MIKRIIGIVSIGVFLVACDIQERTEETLKVKQAESAERTKELREVRSGGVVSDAGRPYFGEAITASSVIDRGVLLPEKLETQNGIKIGLRGVTLSQAAELVQLNTGLIVNVITSYPTAEGGTLDVPIGTRIALNHVGYLSTLLDKLAARTDTSWSFDGTAVTFERMKMVSYSVPLLPYTTQVSSGVGAAGQSSESGSGGSASVNITGAMTQDPWTELELRLVSVALPPSRVVISRGLARIDIFAPPSIQKKAAKIIEEVRELYSKTIQIDVGIYFVNAADVQDFAIGLGLTTSRFDITGAVGQLSGTGVIGYKAGDAGGSRGQLRLLAQNTSVTDSFFASARVQPGVTVPLVNTDTKNYVSGTSVTTTNNSTTASITTSQIISGISLYSVAQITPDGDIVVDTTISQRSLKTLEKFTASNGSTVQLPSTTERIIKGSGVIRSGGWLVLAGYEQDYASKADTGTGKPEIKLLGGSTKSDLTRVQMIVIVRPTLIGK